MPPKLLVAAAIEAARAAACVPSAETANGEPAETGPLGHAENAASMQLPAQPQMDTASEPIEQTVCAPAETVALVSATPVPTLSPDKSLPAAPLTAQAKQLTGQHHAASDAVDLALQAGNTVAPVSPARSEVAGQSEAAGISGESTAQVTRRAAPYVCQVCHLNSRHLLACI